MSEANQNTTIPPLSDEQLAAAAALTPQDPLAEALAQVQALLVALELLRASRYLQLVRLQPQSCYVY